MKKRFICSLLCALLLSALWVPALASEEVDAAPEEVVAETPVPVEPEAETAEPALPAEEEPVSEDAEPDAVEEPAEEEPAAEEPIPERLFGSELPIADLSDTLFIDPEDPMIERAMQQRMDGAYGSTWSAFTTRSLSNETLRYGIDVSAWQSTINWTKVRQSGVEFVFIRGAYRGATSGKLNTDGRFYDYINGAKAAGLKVGVYVFSQAITVQEAEQEADYLLNLVSGYTIDLPLVFDLEHYSGGRFTNARLSRRAVTDMCLAFCRRVESRGYASMVYSNPSMLNNEMYASELGRVWLANYITKTSYSGHKYEYWQCSDHGTISGISGNVDLDFWFQPNAVSATPAPTPDPSDGPFTDVRKSDWFYETVMKAYEAGIVKGLTATAFSPTGTATRGQVVTMIHRLEGTPSWKEQASFTDLTQDYYKDAVYWASEGGVVNGYSETEFRPERAITREELVTILYRMSGSPETEDALSGFSDGGDVQSWARDAMSWAIAQKIVTGYEDGTLHPKANASRAEVCTILMRYDAL